MKNNSVAIGLAIFTLIVGAVLTVAFHRLDIKESATIIAVLITPLLVYGIASGKILELSAPGGWTAKFQEVVRQKVSTTAKSIAEDAKKLVAVPKVSPGELREVVKTLEEGKPIALTLFWARERYQQLETVELYLTELRQLDPALIVILVDKNTQRFVCMIEGNLFSTLLATEKHKLIDAINNGNIDYLRTLNQQRQTPAFIFRRLTKTTTNAEALREMKKLNVKMIVVVDDDDIPDAIVTRDDIVTHVVDELLASEAALEGRASAARA